MDKEYITRKEAAEILGVSQQTITNYMSRGMFGYKTVGTCKKVCKDDVINMRDYVSDSREASENNIKICDKILLSADKQMLENFKKMKSVAMILLSKRLLDVLQKYNKFSNCLTERECEILKMYLLGNTSKEISNVMGITIARVNSIIGSGIEKLSDSFDNLEEMVDKYNVLLEDAKSEQFGSVEK